MHVANSSHDKDKRHYTLHSIGAESANILSALWQQTFRDAYSEEHDKADIDKYCLNNYSVAAARETLSDSAYVCKLSYDKTTAVGLYVLKDQACPLAPEKNAFELKQLYLLATEYGQGLAKIMFTDICDHVEAQNRDTLWLSVSDRNKRAQAYYHKLGFKLLGNGPTFNVGKDTLNSKILVLESFF